MAVLCTPENINRKNPPYLQFMKVKKKTFTTCDTYLAPVIFVAAAVVRKNNSLTLTKKIIFQTHQDSVAFIYPFLPS